MMRLNIVLFFMGFIVFHCFGCSQNTRIQNKCNQNFKCLNSDYFSYELVNKNPIKEYKKVDMPFDIINGKIANMDSAFHHSEQSLAKLLYKSELIPEVCFDSLHNWDLRTMQSFSFFGNNAKPDTGLCCLDVIALYDFKFNQRRYLALYCLEYDENYFPSENEFDIVLMLYIIIGDSLKCIISTKQGDFNFESFGDIDLDGKLDYVHASNLKCNSFVYSYEFNEDSNQFFNTGKFIKLQCDEERGKRLNCEKSCWY